MVNISRSVYIFGVLVTGLVMINCAGTPNENPVENPMVRGVRQSYEQLKADTVVTHHAPEEFAKAKKAVNKLEDTFPADTSRASFRRLALLAKDRIAIARQTAALKAAQDEVEQASTALQRLKANVRQLEDKRHATRLTKMEIDKRAEHLDGFLALKTDRGLVLRFLEVRFGSEKASPSAAAEKPINELTELLNQYPKRNILIEGYTDSTGSAAYNKKLSQQRADAVRQALISRGIAASRIQAEGMGEQYPIASNKTKAGRLANRRVDVVISDKNGHIHKRQQH